MLHTADVLFVLPYKLCNFYICCGQPRVQSFVAHVSISAHANCMHHECHLCKLLCFLHTWSAQQPDLSSFPGECSGNTADQPGLLQYSCRLITNIRPTAAAKVSTADVGDDNDLESMAGVLGGRPILALCFEDMEVTHGFTSNCGLQLHLRWHMPRHSHHKLVSTYLHARDSGICGSVHSYYCLQRSKS